MAVPEPAVCGSSTPVLRVRERLIIMPVVGVVDLRRARQLTERLLSGILAHRAQVVILDIEGVAETEPSVAHHLVQMVQASRLLGATVIVSGVSPDVAATLVSIGVHPSELNTAGDLQMAIDEAERLLGS